MLLRSSLDFCERIVYETEVPVIDVESEPKADLPMISRERARAIFDAEARRSLSMSGEEFIRAWEAGEFDDDPDRPEVTRVVMLLPLAR